MICKNCNRELNDGAKFCKYCGAQVSNEEPSRDVPEWEMGGIYQNAGYSNSGYYPENNGAQYPYVENTNSNNSSAVNPSEQPAVQIPAAKSNDNQKKMIIIAVCALIAAVIVIVSAIFISNKLSTKEITDAINAKNAFSLNSAYSEAEGTSKQSKYDKIIGETIKDMKDDLNSHNFEGELLPDAQKTVESYLQSRWGTLIVSDGSDNMWISVSAENEQAWNELMDLIESKVNYCTALYARDYENDLKKAIEYFSKIIEKDSKFEESKNDISDCVDSYINETLKKVDEYISGGDINAGITLLESVKEYLDECGIDSQQVTQKIDEILKNYAASYAEKAEKSLKDKDVNAAIGQIEVAMELQPDNAEYRAKHEEYQNYLPFYLYIEDNVLNAVDHDYLTDWKYYDSHNTANDNTEFTHVIKVGFHNGDLKNINSTTYNLAGKYDTVTGKIFVPQTYKSVTMSAYFEAYGDGKLLYTSQKVGAGVLPQDISFKVSGVQKLEIKFWGETESTLWGTEFDIANLTAQKDFPQ